MTWKHPEEQKSLIHGQVFSPICWHSHRNQGCPTILQPLHWLLRRNRWPLSGQSLIDFMNNLTPTIKFTFEHSTQERSFLDMKIHIGADHKLSATLYRSFYTSTYHSLKCKEKKKIFTTIPTIEPSHYRWHPTTKRTGFSHSISPCQKILFRNHHSKYFQNPPPLPWHPSPQNPQGIKFQNSPPNCDATLTRRKKLLQVSTRLLAYIIENDTTAQHLTQPPHPYLPQNRIPQGHLSTFLPSQTNISTFCSPWILSVIATDTLAINMQAYASQLHLPTGTDLLIKVT